MTDTNGKKNGTWQGWVVGICASLVVVAVVGVIIAERETAKTLGDHAARIMVNETAIRERTISRFTREDADRMEARLRESIFRVEKRMDFLEKR